MPIVVNRVIAAAAYGKNLLGFRTAASTVQTSTNQNMAKYRIVNTPRIAYTVNFKILFGSVSFTGNLPLFEKPVKL